MNFNAPLGNTSGFFVSKYWQHIKMNIIEFGDCRETMKKWKEQGIKAQTCVTSPPYYGLRDYGTAKWEGGDDSCEHSISMPTKWNDPKRGTNVLRPEFAYRDWETA